MSTLLAIDTSNQFCSVALSHRGKLNELHQSAVQQHSEVILPMVQHILSGETITLNDIDAFVVGVGPGGFTGVRLAVAVVQGLAFATHKPVIALSSLLAMAQSAYHQYGQECIVSVGMDARMQEVYHATYRVNTSGVEELHRPSLSKISDFITTQNQWAQQPHFVLVGNVVHEFAEVTNWCEEDSICISAIDHSAPHARDLMATAHMAYEAKQWVAAEQVVPLYVRDKIAQTIAERTSIKATE